MAWAGRAAFMVTGSPPFGAQLARRLRACVAGSDRLPGFCVARSKSIEYELSWPIRLPAASRSAKCSIIAVWPSCVRCNSSCNRSAGSSLNRSLTERAR